MTNPPALAHALRAAIHLGAPADTQATSGPTGQVLGMANMITSVLRASTIKPVAFTEPFPAVRGWTVGDAGELRAPVMNTPLTSPQVSATCPSGCETAPGPCGGCGVTIVRDPTDFYMNVAPILGKGGPFVTSIVEVIEGPLSPPASAWGSSELRAGAVKLRHLLVPPHLGDHAADLEGQYGVPVNVDVVTYPRLLGVYEYYRAVL